MYDDAKGIYTCVSHVANKPHIIISFCLQKTNPWIQNMTISLHITNGTKTKVGVEISDAELPNSTWNFFGLDVTLTQVNLQECRIFDNNLASLKRTIVHIYNSTFEHLMAERGQITIWNCHIVGGKNSSFVLIDIKDSTLDINESSFQGHKCENGAALIKAMSSEINMTNVQANHNIGSQGLIQILYGSISNFNNVTFKYNGRSNTFLLESLEPIIDVEVNSIATIINSLFSGNTAGNRGSLYSARNSSITISDTYFQNST